MVEIIDFSTKEKTYSNPLYERGVHTRREYLLLCQNILTQQDFFDVVCGILDEEYYHDIEENSIKDIIDMYFSKASP
jgi:hypothetical protein